MAEATCSIAACGGPVFARSWCSKHYHRWRRHGDAETVNPGGPKPVPLVERMWRRITRTDSGCWEWTGSRTEAGYGKVASSRSKLVFTHRAMYELLVEPIPEGLHLDHLCRNPPCCNPSHLEPVTPLENNRRGLGNGSKQRCPQGHEYAGVNLIEYRGRRYCRTCRDARNAARSSQAA